MRWCAASSSCSRLSRWAAPEPISKAILQPPAAGVFAQGAKPHGDGLLVLGRHSSVETHSQRCCGPMGVAKNPRRLRLFQGFFSPIFECCSTMAAVFHFRRGELQFSGLRYSLQ
jgi:hypothetical protein